MQSIDGCEVLALQQPISRSACLIVEVAGGSHDEPCQWPGLAHFLEHMLFRGGRRFRGEQRLMPYVQALGGRVNASTQARLTEYHLEVPAPALESAAERLLDMLVHPHLASGDQLAERDVVDAEYRARANDPTQQALSVLLDALAEEHPCRRFVAGHGASLPADQEPFRQALHDFHQQHYVRANCRVMLVGPQPSTWLQALGQRLVAQLPNSRPEPRQAVVPMLPLRGAAWQLNAALPSLWLGLVLQGPTAGRRGAIASLVEQLSSDLPGSLQQRLVGEGLLERLRVIPAYQHAGQALLALECVQVSAIPEAASRIRAYVQGWLSAQCQMPEQHAVQLPAAYLQSLDALALGRYWLDRAAVGPAVGSMGQWLSACSSRQLIFLQVAPEVVAEPVLACGFRLQREAKVIPAVDAYWPWSAEPSDSLPPIELAQVAGLPAALARWSWPEQHLAALTLRWPLLGPGPAVLEHALRPLSALSARSGLSLKGEAYEGHWQLRLLGNAANLSTVLASALQTLLMAAPDAERERLAELRTQAEMPIRRVLQHLPHYLQPAVASWRGLLLAPTDLDDGTLGGLLQQWPLPVDLHDSPISLPVGRHWHELPGQAAEAALLLFCPMPATTATDEAAWRLLGRCLQPAFFQYIRDDLGLGYAVTSGFHGVAGHCGLLFAVQSPKASSVQLLQHYEAFFQRQAQALAQLACVPLHAAACDLAASLDPLQQSPQMQADMAWCGYLAGHDASHVERVRAALYRLTPGDLSRALAQLQAALGGWLLLSCSSH